MAINTWYQRISPRDLKQLIQDSYSNPDAPTQYLHPELDDERTKEQRIEPMLWTERNSLGLHSLLTFGEWAKCPLLGASISGGTPIGGDYSYEPVRYFTQKEVGDIASALETVKETALSNSFDPGALNTAGVPPTSGWHENDFPHLWKTFQDIQSFFHIAQSQGYAVLVYLG